MTLDLTRSLPKGGKFFFKPTRGPNPAKGTPVFLIDRREPALAEEIRRLEEQLKSFSGRPVEPDGQSGFKLRLPPGSPRNPNVRLMHVLRYPGRRMRGTSAALWLGPESVEQTPTKELNHIWWWLPPVIWPTEEAQCQQRVKYLLQKGARRFVLNEPWQIAMFGAPEKLNLWAGPFCNIANPLAVRSFKLLGGQGVIVSPELGGNDFLDLAAKSVLPLGIVLSGHWPLCVSRTLSTDVKAGWPFTSPRREQAWVRQYGGLYWLYPNWPIDLRAHQDRLIKAGYRLFIHLDEPVPRAVQIKKRPGLWNWELGLK